MSKQTDVENVKHLRESTGLSFDEIKKALDQYYGGSSTLQEIVSSID